MSELLTIKEASKLLKIHPNQLRLKASHGEIKAYKPAQKWLFKMADIENYLDRNDNSLATKGR
jgi:excisionase family DNA binding protein